VILDEMAFFFKDKANKKVSSNSDKNDRTIYEAITPSVAGFKKKDGTPDGKIICISSPGAKEGKFFEEYDRSFNPLCEDQFCMQAPTWEMNPTVSSQYLKGKYNTNPNTYKAEFGGQFTDQLAGWIEDPQILYQCVVPGLRFKKSSLVALPHFMGIDIGLKNDGTAICITHPVYEIVDGVRQVKFEVDVADIRYAKLEGKDYFDPEEMSEWIISYTQKFNIVKGVMDQFYGMAIVPYLKQRGLRQFEFRDFNDSSNSLLYQNLMANLMTSNMRIPEGDKKEVDGKIVYSSELIDELLSLQAEHKSKYLIKVQAPDREGAHDDLSDALARSVLAGTEYKDKGYGSGKLSSDVISTVAGRKYKNTIRSQILVNRPSSFALRSLAGRGSLMAGRRGF
jgi:hypothetical protein